MSLLSVGTAVANVGVSLKKHSPEILMGAGLLGFAGTVVLTIRAKKNIDKTITKYEEQHAETVAKAEEDGMETAGMEMDPSLKHQMVAEVVMDIIPPAAAFVVSSGCVLTSLGVVNSRLTKATTALAGVTSSYNKLSKTFKEYRGRVAEQVGAQEEAKIYRNERKVVKKRVDENGVEHEDEEIVFDTHATNDENYIFEFSSKTSSHCYSGNGAGEYNKQFLDRAEKNLQLMQRTKGSVFVFDVLDALGIDRSVCPKGGMLGWLDTDAPVDLGIYKHIPEQVQEEGNADLFMQDVVWLEFNVPGIIFDRIAPAYDHEEIWA